MQDIAKKQGTRPNERKIERLKIADADTMIPQSKDLRNEDFP